MSATRLVLVRHGESIAQVTGRFFGHGCEGLSERGRAQVQALHDRWKTLPDEIGQVDAVYASLMRRAVETAEIFAPALGVDEIVQDCDLCEVHPGDADGLTWEEIAERWPTNSDAFPNPEIPNGEQWTDLTGRVEGALERIAQRHEGRTVVIACHGGVVAHSLFAHLRLHPVDRERAWFEASNAGITEWVLDPSAQGWQQGRWGLQRYNDHAHTLGI